MSMAQAEFVSSNPRGIPAAPFVDDVSKFVSDNDHAGTLSKFQEMHSKYKFMETHLLQRKAALESKIPELEKTLEAVLFLQKKKDDETEVKTDFEVNETLWAHAVIPPTDKVNLWLGANVMLEYSLDEAQELLSTKLESATTSRTQVEEDLLFLKEQLTTMEVNIARVYNDDIKRKREGKT